MKDASTTRRDVLRRLLIATALVAWRPRLGLAGIAPSNFHRIYGNRADRADFRLFLENVFHLYPEEDFHRLILRLTAHYETDGEIYRRLAERLPGITPRLSALRYALPALRKQKAEMAAQTVALLGDERRAVGYAEIGTTGRYLSGLRSSFDVRGPV